MQRNDLTNFVAEWLADRAEPFTAADVFTALGIPEEQVTPAMATRVGIELRRHGCARILEKSDPISKYTPPSALVAKPGDDADQPVKIFRLPYAEDYYLCTCGAARRPECSCSHEHILDISENHHLRDPEIVEWLVEHREPFSLAEIKTGLWMPIQNRNIDIHLSIRISRELTACGCVRDEKTGLFTPPSLDALRRLNLRAPAGSRSPAAGSAPSPHTEPQQDPRADRQAPSSASKAASDPQAPQ